jgi:glycine cleavage system transcriptional repressor
MTDYLITAQAVDRPGVVALLSRAVAEQNWGIEEASMTRLAGRFAMLLVLRLPSETPPESVSELLHERLDAAGIAFTVDEIIEEPESVIRFSGSPWTVTVYGTDRTGIVASITSKLAHMGVNIDNLSTNVSEGESGPIYSMLIDATVPDRVKSDEFVAELAATGEAMGVTCHAVRVEPDIF